jgi:hypothetical protein
MILTGCVKNDEIPRCFVPSDALVRSAYNLNKCKNGTIHDCSPECKSSHTGTANVECVGNGKSFNFSGCVENQCYIPMHTPLSKSFVVNNCLGMVAASKCDISCASGKKGKTKILCKEDQGPFEISGCQDFSCQLPENGTWKAAYEVVDHDVCRGFVKPEECKIRCTENHYSYDGEPILSCLRRNGDFHFSGCHKRVCALPLDTEGYNVSGCEGILSEDECGVTCAKEFDGTAEATCTETNRFKLSGCTERSCNAPKAENGFILAGCTGETVPSKCLAHCGTNESQGLAKLSCPAWGSEGKLSGCAKNRCSLPRSLHAYNTSGCQGKKTVKDCHLSCAAGFEGNPQISCFQGQTYFDVQGCELKMFDNDWKKNEEHHKKELQRLHQEREREMQKNNCHLHNGRGIKGCPDNLLNRFTHLTPCWKVSACLSNCLEWFEHKNINDEVSCYDSCLCRAGITPKCHPPHCGTLDDESPSEEPYSGKAASVFPTDKNGNPLDPHKAFLFSHHPNNTYGNYTTYLRRTKKSD